MGVWYLSETPLAVWTLHQCFQFLAFCVQVIGVTRSDQEIIYACKYFLFVAGGEYQQGDKSSLYEAEIFSQLDYSLYESVGFLRTALFLTTLSYHDLPLLLKHPAEEVHEVL